MSYASIVGLPYPRVVRDNVPASVGPMAHVPIRGQRSVARAIVATCSRPTGADQGLDAQSKRVAVSELGQTAQCPLA